jgi:hypothetical protein
MLVNLQGWTSALSPKRIFQPSPDAKVEVKTEGGGRLINHRKPNKVLRRGRNPALKKGIPIISVKPGKAAASQP